VLWHDGQGLCLFARRLERGRFIWPSPADGAVTISSAQLGYLLEGIDWRMPHRRGGHRRPADCGKVARSQAQRLVIPSLAMSLDDSLPTDLASAHALIIAQRQALSAAELRGTVAESKAQYRAPLIESSSSRSGSYGTSGSASPRSVPRCLISSNYNSLIWRRMLRKRKPRPKWQPQWRRPSPARQLRASRRCLPSTRDQRPGAVGARRRAHRTQPAAHPCIGDLVGRAARGSRAMSATMARRRCCRKAKASIVMSAWR
jgi:hypothetical protein